MALQHQVFVELTLLFQEQSTRGPGLSCAIPESKLGGEGGLAADVGWRGMWAAGLGGVAAWAVYAEQGRECGVG